MNMSASALAAKINATLEGRGDLQLNAVASPERAGAHDLIYVEAPKHAARAKESAALCVIAAPGIALPDKTVLRSDMPKVAFAKAAALLIEKPRIATGIHPTAIVQPFAHLDADVSIGPYAVIGQDAHIGEGSQIGAHCVIGPGSFIGRDCRLHPRVTLYNGARVGDRVEIHAGVVLGADGFGYAFGEGRYWKFPQIGVVEIGDDVEIGANTTIDRGSLDDTRIAAGVKIDNLVHIAHNCEIGEHTVIAAQTGISGSCTIGKNVIIGGQVGIADRCRIEDRAILGAQAGIPTGKIIREGDTVWGTPARNIDKFKEAYFWQARLPELAERLKQLEGKPPKKPSSPKSRVK
jgi:UDP-3-O-[3-hydroxymyristoyl] glucosamine N-acyltransferase